MNPKPWLGLVLVAFMTGCGGSASPSGDTATGPAAATQKSAERETVLDPWVGTIERAKSVQKTVDEQAAEQRRKIEEASR